MTDRNGALHHAWEVLAAGGQETSRLRVYVLAGVNGPRASLSAEGWRGFLWPVGARQRVSVPRRLQPDAAAALVAEVAYYDTGRGTQEPFLHVWCRDHQADQAFEAFCAMLWDASERLDLSTALVHCSEEFRRLLAFRDDASVSLVGMLGELILLRQLVGEGGNLLEAWTGPGGARHDFRLANVAVEVKTTLRSEARGRTVCISDIDQLQPPDHGRLFLCLVRLERAMAGTISMAALASEVEQQLNDEGRAVFRRTLQDYRGTDDWFSRFELKEQVEYEVRPGFPCLTAARLKLGQLDPGVSKVRYDLALEGAAAFEVPPGSAVAALVGAAPR